RSAASASPDSLGTNGLLSLHRGFLLALVFRRLVRSGRTQHWKFLKRFCWNMRMTSLRVVLLPGRIGGGYLRMVCRSCLSARSLKFRSKGLSNTAYKILERNCSEFLCNINITMLRLSTE